MMKIFFGFILIFLTAVIAQDVTISMQFPIGYCAVNSIPLKYVNQSLYACANASITQESTVIIFSMESTENSVNRMSMALERNASFGCFTYFPKSQQFKMCFNASTTNTQSIHPNDIQEILIDRGIFYGNISNFDNSIDEKIWPEVSSVPGYFQNDFYRSEVYHANEGDKVFIFYEVYSKPGYILKLTVQEENGESEKWEKFNENYIINDELIPDKKLYVQFLVTKELNYRIYVYTFVKNDIVNPSAIDYFLRVRKFANKH